jgi:hypothetical protein
MLRSLVAAVLDMSLQRIRAESTALRTRQESKENGAYRLKSFSQYTHLCVTGVVACCVSWCRFLSCAREKSLPQTLQMNRSPDVVANDALLLIELLGRDADGAGPGVEG